MIVRMDWVEFSVKSGALDAGNRCLLVLILLRFTGSIRSLTGNDA